MKLSRLAPVLALGSLLALSALACGITVPDDPDAVRIRVTGESPSGNFKLITSTDFLVQEDPEAETRTVQLESSDTLVSALPFDRTFDLGAARRFYAAAGSPDGEQQVTLEMKLFVEDQERLSSEGTVDSAFLELIWTLRQAGP